MCLCQAWLAVLCSFFNDASREADSRRVERIAFDVSDYDITDVQREERRSGAPRFLFLVFSPPQFPVADFSKRNKRGRDRHIQREIKYLVKSRM